MDKVILNANVFKRGKFYADHGVVIKNDKIIAVAPSKELKTLKQVSIIDVQGDYLVPGFIDLHTHGLGTFRMDNGKDSIEQISSYLPQFGTTGFLPTIVPHLPSEEERFFQEIVESRSIGANILGFFLEGPFISKTGAINPKTLVNQTRSRARAMRELLKPYRVVFAISPEFPGIDEIMQEMEKPIFITHTQANVKESLAAIANGACHATHFYDVFFSPKETDPGVRPCGAVEVILADPSVSVDFIVDGEHVDPIAVKLALACKPLGKVCLITDANIGAGLPPGIYSGFGNEEVEFTYRGGPARGTMSSMYPGSLHGSGLTMDQAVRNVVAFGIGSLETAISMASTNPANVLGIYGKKGDIDIGFDADIVRLTPDLSVKSAWISGDEYHLKHAEFQAL